MRGSDGPGRTEGGVSSEGRNQTLTDAFTKRLETRLRLLFGSGQPVQTPGQTIETFRKLYPGKPRDTIEQWLVHQWGKEEPTCVGCERAPLPIGRLAQVWPHIIEPADRVHFGGAGYDSLWRGLEAATRSAHRAVKAIDAA